MLENILTNYNTKFKNSQLDHDTITKSKYYYKIYNNKISEPLHKFWFSVPNVKYSNNYSNYGTIRFLMNNKNETILNLINYIKDIGTCLIEKFSPHYSNISIDYPWKEFEQYPYIFTFFTNNTTLFVDFDGNELDYDTLNNDLTYSIIFEISTIRLIPIKLDDIESHTIKINLVLVLIKQDEKKDLKKDLKKFLFTPSFLNNTNEHYLLNSSNMTNMVNIASMSNMSNMSNVSNMSNNTNYFSNLGQKKLPFLNDINSSILLNKRNTNIDQIPNANSNGNQTQIQHPSQSNGALIINSEQILKALSGLKKVNKDKDITEENEKFDDNESQIKSEYIEKKNNLKKVKTKEKSLLKNLQKNSKKEKKNRIKKEKEKEKELELELERELELELEKELL